MATVKPTQSWTSRVGQQRLLIVEQAAGGKWRVETDRGARLCIPQVILESEYLLTVEARQSPEHRGPRPRVRSA